MLVSPPPPPLPTARPPRHRRGRPPPSPSGTGGGSTATSARWRACAARRSDRPLRRTCPLPSALTPPGASATYLLQSRPLSRLTRSSRTRLRGSTCSSRLRPAGRAFALSKYADAPPRRQSRGPRPDRHDLVPPRDLPRGNTSFFTANAHGVTGHGRNANVHVFSDRYALMSADVAPYYFGAWRMHIPWANGTARRGACPCMSRQLRSDARGCGDEPADARQSRPNGGLAAACARPYDWAVQPGTTLRFGVRDGGATC